MTSSPPRRLITIAGAGGQGQEIYDQAVDPDRSTLAVARTIARRAEAAGIDALFTADLLSFGAQGPIGNQDPMIFMAGLAGASERLGLIATVSSTFHHPFHLARAFATLDHISNGRAAWNLVTSSVGEENFGVALPHPPERYRRAAEAIEVTRALWDSWRPGALTRGPEGRAVLDDTLVRPIQHHGDHFTIEGPLNVPPSPQRWPVLFQAGQSAAGLELGARHAEYVFTSLPTLDYAEQYVSRLRAAATSHRRQPGLPRIFTSLHAIYGDTEEEALRRQRDRAESVDLAAGLQQLTDLLGGGVDLTGLAWDRPVPATLIPEVSTIQRRQGRVDIFIDRIRQGWTLRQLVVSAQDTGHWSIAGTPEQVAAAVAERFDAGVLDAITVGPLHDDSQHHHVVDGLLPALRRRGLLTDPDEEPTTLRRRLGLPDPWPTDPRTA